jgi:hypothetical protein
MSEWVDQFQDHQIHSTLKELDSVLTELESSEDTDASKTESLNRIRQVYQLVKATLASVDPNLVSQSSLVGLEEYVQLQVRNLNQYKTTENVSLLKSSSPLDQILTQLATIYVPRVPEDIEGLREALTTFRRSMGQHARQLENEYEKIDQEFKAITKNFAELTEEIKSQKQRLDTAIAQFQQQFSEAESKRREEYTQEANNTRAELTKAVQTGTDELASFKANLRKEFEAGEVERKKQYDSEFESTKSTLSRTLENGKKNLEQLTSQYKETFSTFVKDATESRSAMEADFENSVNEYIEQLESRKSEAEKLVQVIGNTGMVGGYQKLANEERQSAWVWHGITLVFLIGLVAFAIIAFHSTIQGEFKLGVFGARAFVAIAFGLGVAWAARQADKHQEVERRSRKMELELASVDPYLALMPAETRFAVKTELAQRFFAQLEAQSAGKGEKEVTGSALDLLRMALELLSKK